MDSFKAFHAMPSGQVFVTVSRWRLSMLRLERWTQWAMYAYIWW